MLPLARFFLFLGILFIVIGGLLYLGGRFNLPLGRLPGDIRIVRENFTCFFPLTTMILVSVLLTIALNVAARLLGRK